MAPGVRGELKDSARVVMSKKKVSEMEKGAGLFQGLVTGIMDVVREKRIPFEAVYRLAQPEGRETLTAMVQMAHEVWLAEQSPDIKKDGALPPDHYRVPVTYAGMPSLEELKREWGKDNVSDIFDGRPFTLHASCQGMEDRTPGEKIFYLHDPGRDWESEERIAWGLKQRNAAAPKGYRPATEQETYEFAKAHPELADFVGLGSFALSGGSRCVAGMWRGGCRRLYGDLFDHGWGRGRRVLFVCKPA